MTVAQPAYQKAEAIESLGLDAGALDRAKERLGTFLASCAGPDGNTGGIDPLAARAARDVLEPGPLALFRLKPHVLAEMERVDTRDLGRFLAYRYRFDVYPEHYLLDAYPPSVEIELTSMCNFRCVFCFQSHRPFTRKSNGHMGHMPLERFRRLIDELAGKVEAITFASRGEPLLCPDITPMLAAVAGRFLALKINTNASMLTEDKCHALLSAGVSTLVFSADAAEEPLYGRLRRNGKLDQVVRNIRQFNQIRAAHYPGARTLTRVSGVHMLETEQDIEMMQAFWSDMVDQVTFVRYYAKENVYDEPLSSVSAPCSDLWRRMMIWWDGTVNPCEVDFMSALALGSVDDASISDLWRGPAYQALREHHQNGQRARVHPCNRCSLV
ncbi:radical SAM/SPASM domain-containing protein [Pararhodospirillum oryzae]|uniref:Radical SAM protein n=1 Tax=Pararhodospirillum oryzae TaxID=478448 RepID=A0A512H9R2_9PROT|nr:radical SAM/SPASM domain-containing protein [Pararhodospirillum oryzae]GEO82168.1 radical SAM protein [Pararhodospirillum oryzae]